MKLNNAHGYLSNGLKQQADAARATAKRAELERYFPGLYARGKKESSPPKSVDFDSQLQSALSPGNIQKETKADPQKKKLYEAALEFQSLFIDRMLSSMRKNLNSKNDLLYGGFRQKIFEDMLYEEYSRMLSRTDSFGLADDIYRQLSPALESKVKIKTKPSTSPLNEQL